MRGRRVVVTGMGLVTPLGCGLDELWQALMASRSGVVPITEYDASKLPVRFAGIVRNFDPVEFMSAKEVRRVDPFIQYAIASAYQAVSDANLDVNIVKPARFGVCVGSGIGGIGTIEQQHELLLEKGPKRLSPFFVPGSITNLAAGHLSILFGAMGPSLCLSTACTSGTHSIGMAARLIASGDIDIALAGGAEKGSACLGMAGFAAARALSTRNDDPQAASRPWDQDRDGFVLSDGAGILVLESLEHAQARGTRIYAEIAGFGMSSDAHHVTAPLKSGEGACLAMANALSDAGIGPGQVDYINAHGTSTVLGDLAEVLAVKALFGDKASAVPISSTKSMLGHMLGAAGAVEAAVTVLALIHQVAPPTLNLQQCGQGCDLDFVPNQARPMSIQVALSNSFGFGGTNACLAVRRWPDGTIKGF